MITYKMHSAGTQPIFVCWFLKVHDRNCIRQIKESMGYDLYSNGAILAMEQQQTIKKEEI